MTLREKLLSNFPSSFDKSKPVFRALIANEKGSGTIEKTLNNLLSYMKEWRDADNLYDMTGVALFKTCNLISFLSMFEGETEDAFKNRLKSLFVRGGDVVWGTVFDIKQLFQAYFKKANVYVLENVDNLTKNKILDYDFASEDLDVWTYNNCHKDKTACFSKAFGVLFDGDNGNCCQTITGLNSNKSHHLHFFYNGKVKIEIKDIDTNKYWNGSAWVDTAFNFSFVSAEWKNDYVHFVSGDIPRIKLTIYGEENTMLDYVTLYEYTGYPTFKVFVQYLGDSGERSLALAPGEADPTEKIANYNLAGYYEQVYMTGHSSGFSQQIYEELLGYVKSEGVKAFMEFVTKNN